jgi:hypothetical protein
MAGSPALTERDVKSSKIKIEKLKNFNIVEYFCFKSEIIQE